jgi:hypothetical protein
MAFQYSTAVRTATLDPVETVIGTTPRLYLYTGSVPASCAAAATGTLLNSASYSLPADWMNAASGGTKTLAGTWSVVANASGTAGYFRILDSAGTTVGIQGTVGTSGADMNLDNNVIASGQTINITAFTLTAGGA